MKYQRHTLREATEIYQGSDKVLCELENRIEDSPLLSAIFSDEMPYIGMELWKFTGEKAEKFTVGQVDIEINDDTMKIHFEALNDTQDRWFSGQKHDIGQLIFLTKEECEEFEKNKPF